MAVGTGVWVDCGWVCVCVDVDADEGLVHGLSPDLKKRTSRVAAFAIGLSNPSFVRRTFDIRHVMPDSIFKPSYYFRLEVAS